MSSLRGDATQVFKVQHISQLGSMFLLEYIGLIIPQKGETECLPLSCISTVPEGQSSFSIVFREEFITANAELCDHYSGILARLGCKQRCSPSPSFLKEDEKSENVSLEEDEVEAIED